MPKNIHEIKEFSGGLINVADPRDIPDNALHLSNNAVVARTGKIMMMGKEVPHNITSDNQLITNITAGYGLYLFRTDFNYTRGMVNTTEYGTPGYQLSGSDPTFIENTGSSNISSAGATWGGNNTLRIICDRKHKLTTGSKVSIYCSGLPTHNVQSVPVNVISETSFDYVSAVSFTLTLPVNWICDDSYYISDITDNDSILESKPGSFGFLILQNGHKFHLHSQTSGKFFENVGLIQGAGSSGIEPEFIYIDDAVRISNGNFNNNSGYIGPLQRTFSPRWFGFIPIREQFITNEYGGISPGRVINPGWRDEVNNVYDADCILGTSDYVNDTSEAADTLFTVENGDGINDGFTSTTDSSFDTTGLQLPMRTFMSVSAGTDADKGDWQMEAGSDHEELKFGISYIYDEHPYEQESRLFKSTTSIKMHTMSADSDVNNVSLLMEFKTAAKNWPVRVIGFSIYLWYMNHELSEPRWIGSSYFDKKKGWVGHDGVHREWEVALSTGDANYMSRIVLTGSYRMRAIPSVFYKYRNGYSHNEDSCTHRYKTAAVVNNKLYAGNVMQVGGTRHGVIFQDRMLVSPTQKFDILPANSELTVSTSDGDEIIALVSFGSELLQFKRRSLYIIFCGDATGEQVKSTHKFHGIYSKDAVTKFEGGIIWVNPNGVYVYDGEQIYNLIYQKIDLHFFRACLGPSKTASIGYLATKKQVVIYFEQNPYASPRIDNLWMDMDGDASTGGLSGERAHCLIYDLDTDTWAFGTDKTSSEIKTNMVDDYTDKLMFGIGSGVYNENSSVFVVGDINVPKYATGDIVFYSQGIWNNTYNELHVHQGGGTWKYMGTCDLGIDGETSLEGTDGMLVGGALAFVIQGVLNIDHGSSTDEYGNATTMNFNTTLTEELLEDNLEDDDPIDS